MRTSGRALIATIAACMAVGVATGCSTGQDVKPNPTPPPGVIAAKDVATGAGRSVTLRVVPSARCWYLTESEGGRVLGTVSACADGTTVSASRVMGAVVVVSDCLGSATVKAGMTAQDLFLTGSAVDGIFVVPANVLTPDLDSVTYACVDDQGVIGQSKTAVLAR